MGRPIARFHRQVVQRTNATPAETTTASAAQRGWPRLRRDRCPPATTAVAIGTHHPWLVSGILESARFGPLAVCGARDNSCAQWIIRERTALVGGESCT